MPVISFATSKGGAGKTISSIVLATTLARHFKVTVIDTDPEENLMGWADKGNVPDSVHVFASTGENAIHDEIDRAKETSDFVIVDLEGKATRLNAYAMGESDLVIIPLGDEEQDARKAIDTLAALAMEARAMRRDIPVRLLFAKTEPGDTFKSRHAKRINAEMKETFRQPEIRLGKDLTVQVCEKIGVFDNELKRRAAYSALYTAGGTLYDLDTKDCPGAEKAILNAELVTKEILETLAYIKEIKEQEKANV